MDPFGDYVFYCVFMFSRVQQILGIMGALVKELLEQFIAQTSWLGCWASQVFRSPRFEAVEKGLKVLV